MTNYLNVASDYWMTIPNPELFLSISSYGRKRVLLMSLYELFKSLLENIHEAVTGSGFR